MSEFWERFMNEAARSPADKRDRAIEAVGAAAPAEWLAKAQEAVRVLAEGNVEFTTDDVWGILDKNGAGSPPEPRAMGAIMKQCKDRGWIEPTFMTRPSNRASCNCRPVRVWKSRIQVR